MRTNETSFPATRRGSPVSGAPLGPSRAAGSCPDQRFVENKGEKPKDQTQGKPRAPVDQTKDQTEPDPVQTKALSAQPAADYI